MKLFRAPSSLALSNSKLGYPQLLWSACASVSPSHSKEFLPYIQSKFTCFSLQHYPCPVTTSLGKKRLSIFLVTFFKCWKAAIRSSWLLLFSRMNNHKSLSLSSYTKRCYSPQTISMALRWTCSRRLRFFYLGSAPSRSWNVSHQVPRICGCSSTSEGLKPDLLLEIHRLESCGTSTWQWKLRQKKLLGTSASSMSAATRFSISFIRQRAKNID